MASSIDPSRPFDGAPASKADLRANLQAAKDDIEALQSRSDHVADHGARGDARHLVAVNQITFSENVGPMDGDTLTINGVVLTFRDSPAVTADVAIPQGIWSLSHASEINRNLRAAIRTVAAPAIDLHLEFLSRIRNLVARRKGASGQQGTVPIVSSNEAAVSVSGWTLGATATVLSTTLTVPGATFTAEDVGKLIAVQRAGPTGNTDGVGMTHWTTIASVSGAETIEMADAASNSCAEAEIIYGTLDQDAVEDAIDAAEASGRPAVVEFSQGRIYLVHSLKLARSVPLIVRGNGAVLMQAPGVHRDAGPNRSILDCSQNWLLNHAAVVGNLFPQVVIQDLTVDGASWFQNNEQWADPGTRNRYVGRFNHEQNHGVKCHGVDEDGVGDDLAAWVPVTLDRVRFQNICGDGIHVAKNAVVAAYSPRGFNVFRGTLTVVSQCNSIYVSDLQTDDDDRMGDYFGDNTYNTGAQSGIYFEGEDRYPVLLPEGFPFTQGVSIDGAFMKQGRVTVSTLGNTADEVVPTSVAYTITIRNMVCPPERNIQTQCVFWQSGPGQINLYDCVFYGGHSDQDQSVRIGGGNVRAFNCRFVASNNTKRLPAPAWVAAVKIRLESEVNYSDVATRFVHCTFTVDDTVDAGTPAYGIWIQGPDPRSRLPANFLEPLIHLDGPHFAPLRYRDASDGPGGSHPAHYRLLDYAVYATRGSCNADVRGAGGLVKKGFRWDAIANGYDSVLRLGGSFRLLATEAMFDGSAQGSHLCRAYLESEGTRLDDAYWGIVGDDTGLHRLTGDLILNVENDPTLAGPVTVTDQWVATYGPLLLHGRLAPGRGIVAGSVTFTETQNTPNLSYSDDGAGSLIDDADGATIVGAIDYGTGWFQIDPPASRIDAAVRWRVSYQHDNERPGFAGMIAQLKSDPAQRWRCTATSTTAATWTALP